MYLLEHRVFSSLECRHALASTGRAGEGKCCCSENTIFKETKCCLNGGDKGRGLQKEIRLRDVIFECHRQKFEHH